ncbi:hypothetical protein [Bdellovibrio bacteriovorus]|uniref:hypothetical protein n=1 Tax=Bdellovibrio bacteriovorus TaxID=959 RepID=UPI003AA969EB
MYIVYLTVFLLACYFPKLALSMVLIKFLIAMVGISLNMQNVGRTVNVANPTTKNEMFLVLNSIISVVLFFSVFIPADMLASSLGKFIYFDFGGSLTSYITTTLNQPWGGFYVILFYLLLTNVRFNFFALITQPIYASTLFISTVVANIIEIVANGQISNLALMTNKLTALAFFGAYLIVTIVIRRYNPRTENLLGESSSLSFANKFFCISQDKKNGYAPNAETLWTDSLRLFKRLYFVVLIVFFASVTKVVDSDKGYFMKRNQINCNATDAELTVWFQNNRMNPYRNGEVRPADNIQALKTFMKNKCK